VNNCQETFIIIAKNIEDHRSCYEHPNNLANGWMAMFSSSSAGDTAKHTTEQATNDGFDRMSKLTEQMV
jgi:hypothetical protein